MMLASKVRLLLSVFQAMVTGLYTSMLATGSAPVVLPPAACDTFRLPAPGCMHSGRERAERLALAARLLLRVLQALVAGWYSCKLATSCACGAATCNVTAHHGRSCTCRLPGHGRALLQRHGLPVSAGSALSSAECVSCTAVVNMVSILWAEATRT